MKTTKKFRFCCLAVIVFLSASSSSYGQSRQDKTTSIINKFHFVDHQKRRFQIQMQPLKKLAHGNDSIKIVDIEKQLTREEISKRVCTAFYEVFNDDEINDIYNFMQTDAYRKLSNSGEIFKTVANQFSDIDKEIEGISEKLGIIAKNMTNN